MVPAIITFVTIHVRPSAQAVPLAAASIAAALPEPYRQQVNLVDAYLSESDEEILARLNRIVAADNSSTRKCIGFSMYLWNKHKVLALAQTIRLHHPTTLLLVGGPEATACQQQLAALHLFDHVIAGEGELAITPVLKTMLETFSRNHPGMDSGMAEAEPAADQRAGVVDMQHHVSPWLSNILSPRQGVLWEISRGCPFKCAFCYDARGNDGVRTISMQRLEQELILFTQHNVSQVWVLDSTFNFPVERGKQLLRLIARHAPHIHFHLEAKAEFLDEETVFLLRQICCSVQVGLQSAQPQVLRRINRALDVDQFSAKLQLLGAAGITFGIDLIYGLPGDTVDGFRDTIDFALQFYPNQVEMFPLALLPGTRLFDHKNQYGLHAQSEPPYTIISTDTISARQLQRCRIMAAACDIFYNTGRAMAYFIPLCEACGLKPVELVEYFAHWLDDNATSINNHCKDGAWWEQEWSAQQTYQLQLKFIPELLRNHRLEHLQALALDIVRWHKCWSDTLIADETLPAPGETVPANAASTLLQQSWRLAPAVTIEQFSYPVDELSILDEIDLIELGETLHPFTSTGLFIRRGEEVFCEAIDDILASLLQQSCGRQSAAEILIPFAGDLTQQQRMELLTFAVSEGLLLPGTESIQKG